MTARQIIQEIEALPAKEQREVFVSLQERLKDDRTPVSTVHYLDHEVARPMIKEILTKHSDLFRKLSQ